MNNARWAEKLVMAALSPCRAVGLRRRRSFAGRGTTQAQGPFEQHADASQGSV